MMFDFKSVAVGVILALLALFAGETLGLSFGAKEDSIKDFFKSRAVASSDTDISKNADKITEKSWHYLKRSHEHFMGLGAVAMALILFAGLSPTERKIKLAVTTLVGFGAFVYPLAWGLIALQTSSVGAHSAKESIELIAQAGAGSCFIGLIGSIYIAVKWFLSDKQAACTDQ